jgi:hypothetical protein
VFLGGLDFSVDALSVPLERYPKVPVLKEEILVVHAGEAPPSDEIRSRDQRRPR